MGVSMLQRHPTPCDRDWDLFFDFSIHDKDFSDKRHEYQSFGIDDFWMSEPLKVSDVSSGPYATPAEQDDSDQLSGQSRQDASGNDSHDISISRRASCESLLGLDDWITVTSKKDVTVTSPVRGRRDSPPREPECSRSLQKHGRADTPVSHSSSITKRFRRRKQSKRGYPCNSCHETFDRACDQKKHFQRTHAPKNSHQNSCSLCSDMGILKSFLYPKDLRRHIKQVHNTQTDVVPAHQVHNVVTNSVSTHGSTPWASIWMIAMVVVKFRRLRTSREHGNVIMVSKDEFSFVEVDVRGVASAAALCSRILSALGQPAANASVITARSYSSRHGQTTLGHCLDEKSLYSLVLKAADTQGSLKLLITVAAECKGGKRSSNTTFDTSTTTVHATPTANAAIDQIDVLVDNEVDMNAYKDFDTPDQRTWTLLSEPRLQRRNLQSLPPGKGEVVDLLLHENVVHDSRQARSISVRPQSSAPRSRSAPPFNGREAVKSRTTSNHNEATEQATTSKPTQQTASTSSRWFPLLDKQPQRKRNEDDGNESTFQRTPKRLKSCSKISLPCPYHVGPDASQFVTHSRRHEYFSVLLRHLICHDKYFCAECIVDFGSAESLAQHKNRNLRPCQKVCHRSRCRRKWPAGSSPPEQCICISSQEQQWRQLFERIYPDDEIPDISPALEHETGQAHTNHQLPVIIDCDFAGIDMEGIDFLDLHTLAQVEAAPFEDAESHTITISPARDSIRDISTSITPGYSAVLPRSQSTRGPTILSGALWQMLEDIAPLRTQRDSLLWHVVHSHTPGLATSAGRVLSTAEAAAVPSDEDFAIVCGLLWQTLGDIAPERTKAGSWLRLLAQKHAPGLISCTEPVILRG